MDAYPQIPGLDVEADTTDKQVTQRSTTVGTTMGVALIEVSDSETPADTPTAFEPDEHLKGAPFDIAHALHDLYDAAEQIDQPASYVRDVLDQVASGVSDVRGVI